MKLNRVIMLFALIMLPACSKQNGQSTTADSSNQDASISLINEYFLGNSQITTDWYRITELQNTGKVGITAFQGKWTIKDDLGATVDEQEIRFTSDTPYASREGNQPSHVIAPGEKFVIINKDGADINSDFASTKENLTNCIYGYDQLMQQFGSLENCRVTKKITFDVEKIVSQ